MDALEYLNGKINELESKICKAKKVINSLEQISKTDNAGQIKCLRSLINDQEKYLAFFKKGLQMELENLND